MLSQVIEGFAISLFAMFCLLVLVILPVYWFGPLYETKYFPVVTNYVVTKVEPAPDDKFAWYQVTFDKLRTCASVDAFEWYIIRADGTEKRVDIAANNRAPINRPVGVTSNIRYRIDNLNEGEFITQRVVLTHQCHMFWITRTAINIPIGSK